MLADPDAMPKSIDSGARRYERLHTQFMRASANRREGTRMLPTAETAPPANSPPCIHETHMLKLGSSPAQRKFRDDKRDSLTAQCRNCEVRPLCNGGCPKRLPLSRGGEPGQN